jgi:hypothetical protein
MKHRVECDNYLSGEFSPLGAPARPEADHDLASDGNVSLTLVREYRLLHFLVRAGPSDLTHCHQRSVTN